MVIFNVNNLEVCMRLSAKMLKNVVNVNHWDYTSQVYISEGNVNEFYFQLVNLDKTIDKNPIRYISEANIVSAEVFFESLDNSKKFSVQASQPFAGDKSIWKVSLLSTQVPNAGSIKISLTEGGVVKTFIVQSAIRVDYSNIGSC